MRLLVDAARPATPRRQQICFIVSGQIDLGAVEPRDLIAATAAVVIALDREAVFGHAKRSAPLDDRSPLRVLHIHEDGMSVCGVPAVQDLCQRHALIFHQPSEKTLKLPFMAYAIATTASSESLLQMLHV